MSQTIITIAWTENAMDTLFANVPDRDRVKTITVDAECGMRTMEMMPHWMDAGFVETFRAESLVPLT